MDDTRLELVTSRTSSGCATSCANRPFPFGLIIVTDCTSKVKNFFHFFSIFLQRRQKGAVLKYGGAYYIIISMIKAAFLRERPRGTDRLR